MSRILVLFIFLFTSTLAQANPLDHVQERITIYLKGDIRTGDIEPEEMTEIGSINELLDSLNKEEYRQAIEFLRDSWKSNEHNAQRLFIFLQTRWHTRVGAKLLRAEVTKKYTDRTMGLAAGTAVMALNYTSLLRPLIGLRRNPLKALSFTWTSGAPIATTFAASPILQNAYMTKEAKELIKNAPDSPAEILGFPMAMPYSDKSTNYRDTHEQYEADQLYSWALSLGVSGITSDLMTLRTAATGVKTLGSTAGRVVLILSIATVVGVVSETVIDVGVQSLRFDKLANDLRSSINQLKTMSPKDPKVFLTAQNIYAKTINLSQFQLLSYIKALQSNGPLLESLKAKVAANLCEIPKDGMFHSSWTKDVDEVDYYYSQKEIRDGLLFSMRNKQCQAEVDQYNQLSTTAETDPSNAAVKKSLEDLTNQLAKRFSEGKFCGDYMEGHPINLLLSASLFLKQFPSQDLWPQIQGLDEKFMTLLDTREEALGLQLLSPYERKVRDGELPNPADFYNRRQEWAKRHLKQKPQ